MELMKYPTLLEVPEDYWTITTTACIDGEKVDIHWHHNED